MENTFNLDYQKQLFQLIGKAVDFKQSMLKDSLLLLNGGKDKDLTSLAVVVKQIVKKQEKHPDDNVAVLLTLLKAVDEAVLKLESGLELKNSFANDVLNSEVVLMGKES